MIRLVSQAVDRAIAIAILENVADHLMIVVGFGLDLFSYILHENRNTQIDNVCNNLDLNIRLVGGKDTNEGRVEVAFRGKWGTICDNGWGINEAKVVCRHLGYYGVLEAKSNAFFGQGSGEIILDHVTCTGDEITLGDCIHSEWGVVSYGHQTEAGVVCMSGKYLNF